MRYAPLCVFVLTIALQAAGPPKPDETPTIRLAPQKADRGRALKYELLPGELEQVRGNAAPIWVRAGLAARRVNYRWTNEEWEQMMLPLGKLPVKHFRGVIDKHAFALKLAEQASLRTYCDWERPPLTMQTLADPLSLPLEEIQTMREVANLIKLRCRLELAERDFDRAHGTLRVGLVLARHLGQSEMLIQDLVALAITAIMLGQIEEWAQLPGSPNLYWPLTALPRPFIDTRRSVRTELDTIYRSFPTLRELKDRKLTGTEAEALVGKVFDAFASVGEEKPADWMKKLAMRTMAIGGHAAAKKALVAGGWTKKEVDRLPPLQVVVLAALDEHDRNRDDVVRLLSLPSWQAHPLLEKLEKRLRTKEKTSVNVFTTMLMPALLKVQHAQLRTERYVAALRAGEAIRAHVAAQGRPPARWSELALPSPIDPFTGKDLAEWYRAEEGKAVLNVPPPPGMTSLLGRRYVWEKRK